MNQHSHTQPLQTKLAILQQAEYEWDEYQDWYTTQTTTQTVEPKQWTAKLTLLKHLVTMTTPVMGEDHSLLFWNSASRLPQLLFMQLVVAVATLKLRWLQARGLQVIGIAGSYAKTSTKQVLTHVLSKEKRVLATSGNINTRFGIARIILQELNATHQLFIAEFGEYFRGDIKRFTQFLRPAYKVMTPVGHAHLHRFGTPTQLEAEFAALITTAPHTPLIVHEQNKQWIEKLTHLPVISWYGSSLIREPLVSRGGTECTLTLGEHPFTLFIPLLGIHNAINCIPAILIAMLLGIEEIDIKKRLRTLAVVPHRLEPTLLEQGILLLDNGYNSNPQAARESLHVLKEIEGTHKIVITPGFVDMGATQRQANETFGSEIAAVADAVGIIHGANHSAIRKGLLNAGFDEHKIVEADSETELMEKLTPQITANSVILFENSIPQIYKRETA